MLTADLSAASPRAPGLAALAAGLLALAALAALIWTASRPAAAPPPQAATPALERMMRHVDVLAAAPRPIATAANGQARDYIVGQLRGMGLQPAIQKTTVQKSTISQWGGTHVTLGVVHNVVVRLPGSAPDRLQRPALLLASHLDSGKTTLGAARGAAQVAAMLETARSLRSGARHLNDIVLLFADGEQVGGLGAKGFAEQHPLAQQVGLTLKFDGAGSAGPLTLVDAAGADGAVLRGWRQAAPAIEGSSLGARLYKLVPDMPRVGPLAAIDAPILLFANTGRPFDAEGTLDSVDRLDPAMLANLGESILGLARHFGDAALARGVHQPHAWFSLPLLGSVQHPAILSWGLAALAGWLLVRGYRAALIEADNLAGNEADNRARREAAPKVQGSFDVALRLPADDQPDRVVAPLAQGFFGVALLLVATRMLLWERRDELAALTRAQDAGAALAFAFAGGCLFIGALYLLRRLAGATAVFLGTMAWLAIALLLMLLIAPDAAWLLAWPLAAALGAHAALPSVRKEPLRVLVLAAGLAPALLLFVPALRATWTALAPHGLYLASLAMTVMLLCFASLLLLLPAGRVIGAALALSLATGLALPGSASDSPPPAPERAALAPNRLVYFKDMNSWRAYWLHPGEPLDAWSKGLFPNLDRPAVYVDVFGWHSPRQWYAIAPREDRIAFPEAYMFRNPALVKTSLAPPLRQVSFTLRSKNRAPHIEMWVAGTKPQHSTLNGRVLSAQESGWSLSLYGMEDELLSFTIDAPADDLLAVVVEERMPGLPEHLLPPGAPKRMPGTGMTVSSDVLRFY